MMRLMSIYLENRLKGESNFAKLCLALKKEKRNDDYQNFVINFRKHIMYIIGKYINFYISDLRKMIDEFILVAS
jgi:septum formation topological specificity factor MinE